MGPGESAAYPSRSLDESFQRLSGTRQAISRRRDYDLQGQFNTEEFRSCMEEFGQWASQFGEETKEPLVTTVLASIRLL